jgi:hypothetical protein
MKNLIRSFLLLAAIITFSGNQIQAEVKNKSLLGEWVYEVTDAPYGYDKGSLIFADKDGETTCVVKLEAGELAVSDLKIEDNKITFTTSVDGSSINVVLTKEEDKLTGLVDSPEGPKKISAVKK